MSDPKDLKKEVVISAAERFAFRKCRPGSLAMHAVHGIVRVVRASGEMRSIEVDHYVDDDVEIVEDDLDPLAGERATVSELDVSVTELTELDPFKDMAPRVVGRVVHQMDIERSTKGSQDDENE